MSPEVNWEHSTQSIVVCCWFWENDVKYLSENEELALLETSVMVCPNVSYVLLSDITSEGSS